MKSLYKSLTAWLLCLVFIFSNFIVSFADVKSLMIGSSSNAFMTLELDDTDYLMMSPRSSVGTVENTISNNVEIAIVYYDASGTAHTKYVYPELDNNRFDFYTSIPDGYIASVSFGLLKGSLPNPGGYKMSFDFASDFSVDLYSSAWFRFFRKYYNANSLYEDVRLNTFSQVSGDIYIPPVEIDISSINWCQFRFYIKDAQAQGLKNVGGSFAVNFTRASVGDGAISTGEQMSDSDYQSDVSSSLSDLSSSVDTMTDEISGVTEAIQNLQGAMEPHYSNVLTQLHHITEQLHAFYDQIYNNIHLKEYALWQDIKTAIENIDLEVNVNLDKLKTSIDNMSTAIQNKLQSVTDTITGGFDNASIEQNGNELDSSITEFEEAEQNVLESVNDSLNDFEFDADLSEYKNIVQVISDFLQELYDSSGGFKLVINLSLMLSVASIVIGVYRFKEGG